MAQIIKDQAQIDALDTVNARLKQIKAINLALTSEESIYQIQNTQNKRSDLIEIPVELNNKVENILKTLRSRHIKDIKTLSDRYKLALDDTDLAIISDDALIIQTETVPDMQEETIPDTQEETVPDTQNETSSTSYNAYNHNFYK